MAADKDKVLGPSLMDTRLRNQFLKVGRITLKDVEKNAKELPDDSEWATWVPLEQILKDEEEETQDLPSTH